MRSFLRTLSVGGLGLALVGCASQGAKQPSADLEVPVLTGDVTREQIEASAPEWVEAQAASALDVAAAQALAAVPPGAQVTVFLGTWCGDSRREVSRLWRALDEVGGEVPFSLRWVALDRDKQEPGNRQAGEDIRYVPTVIVKREDREVGRIIETSPHGIELDLGALLSGKASGPISASRPELLSADAPG